jgi:membrane protease YdiL (CAAX protease family)
LHLINFFSVAILWAIIVPLVLGLPNNREYIGYFKDIRLAKIKPVLRSIGLGIITAIITLALMLLANYLASLFQGSVLFDPVTLTYPTTLNIYTSLQPGIWEEVAFRGVMLVLILKVQKKEVAIISNGLLFGIFHITNLLIAFLQLVIFEVDLKLYPDVQICFQIVWTTFLGIFLAYMFSKTKMLLPCIIYHYLIDAFSTLVIYNSEPENWAYLSFMLFVGIGTLPMLINIPLVRSVCFWFSEPDDEIIPFFDTFLVTEKRLKQYKKDIRAA